MNSFVWALIGNKVDIQSDEVEKERKEAQCKKLQTKLCYSVSAKTGHNVAEAFENLIITIHRRRHSQPHKPSICIENTKTNDTDRKSCC